ncbi:C1 peptidase family protein [Aureococcus anophagefferens]|uniref:C1 peptidase family protein n=1 Tax=Aureococcus anophagefferens TaxID=44056 RepID=A0ABR1FNF2_AURAN
MAVYEPIPGGEAPAVRRKRRIVKATVGLAAVLVVAANVGRHYLSLGRDLELEASVIASTKVVYGDMEAAKVRDLYEQFKRRERRDFDDAEDARRFAIFRRNLATIDTLNAANPAAVFGITSFCDRTDEERQSVKMQTEFSDYASLKRSLALAVRGARALVDDAESKTAADVPGDKHLYNYSGGMPTWQWQHGFVNGSGDPAYFNATQGEVAWVSASDCAACDRFPHFGDYDMGNLPDDFDWRALGAVTAVKNQKYCGSCWSFSSAGDIEGTMFLAGDDLISLSTQQLVSCNTYNYGCDGGWPFAAMEYVSHFGGLVPMDDYPYKGICMDNMCGGTEIFTGTPTCDKELLNGHLAAGDVAAIEGYQFVAMGAEYEDLMHVALVKNGPLSLAFNANGMEFYVHGVVGCTEQMCEAGGVDHHFPCDPTALDHAVLLVGYGTEVRDVTDANGMPTGETFDVPYWLIKNSWDTEWGEGGYYRLVRGVNACGVANMVVHSVHKKN